MPSGLGNEPRRADSCELVYLLRENEDAQLFVEAKSRNKFRLQSARRLILIFLPHKTAKRIFKRTNRLALLPAFLCSAFLKDRLRRGQSRDRHEERRGAHIVESHLMAEFHAR